MIERKDLKNGTEIAGIYREGYATEGIVVPMVIKKVTKDYIIATKKGCNDNYKFIGKDLLYESLRYSRYQKFNLFLGTVKEAEKFDKQRAENESLYSNNQELILSKLPYLSKEDLEIIINIIKKY